MFGLHRRDATLISLLMFIGVAVLVASWWGAREITNRLVAAQAEEAAIHWGEFVRENLSDMDATLSYGKITEGDQELIGLVAEAGNVFRYKFFNQDGIIVLASRLNDLGTKNTKPYFASIVQRGGTFVKVNTAGDYPELKGREQGREGASAVAEAYVPIMENGEFRGALEIYTDSSSLAESITEQMKAAQLGLLILLALLAVTGGFVIRGNVVDRNRQLSTMQKAHESMARAEEEVLQLNEGLEKRVVERTGALERAAEELRQSQDGLQKLNAELEQRVEERTAQTSKAMDQLYKANESISRLNEGLEKRVDERTEELGRANEGIRKLNEELEQRVQERTAELNEANERITRMNTDLERRVDERTADLEQANKSITQLNQELEQRVEERTGELREAQAELLQSERLAALGQLTATVSHELRNPLGAIRTAVYLVGSRIKDKGLGVESALERADRSITRCDNIINELLDYTRQTDLSLETVPFDEWLQQVLDEQKAPEGIAVRNQIAPGGPELAFDQDRLRRVIINVFNNGCEAMGEDIEEGNTQRDHTLTVSTRVMGERLEVLFRDTGPGIDAQTLAKIFEPLYSTKSFGVGLGLPTVKQIMEQHSGGIEITSEPGRGTSVLLWLPLRRVDEKAA